MTWLRAWPLFFVFLVLASAVFAQPAEREHLEMAASILKANSKQLETLAPILEKIRDHQAHMLKEIHYLRIRNRKKGNVRVGGDRLVRLRKIDLVERSDPKALRDLDERIDRAVEKINE